MATYGFTIGIGDCICSPEVIKGIKDDIIKGKTKVHQLLENAKNGTLKNRQPGTSLIESFEKQVNGLLGQIRDQVGKQAQNSLKDHNNMKILVGSGSKGSMLNISQIMACVGQQNVVGQRINAAFNRRTLPHFCKDDLGPEARGFVSNS